MPRTSKRLQKAAANARAAKAWRREGAASEGCLLNGAASEVRDTGVRRSSQC